MKKLDVFKCVETGLVVEVLSGSDDCCAQPTCCGKPMQLMKANSVDASAEKHVPVLSGDEKGVLVKIGSLPHPMEEKHYIEWVEVINGDYVNRKYLKPGDKPEAAFYVPMQDKLEVRIYCNLHGLWKK